MPASPPYRRYLNRSSALLALGASVLVLWGFQFLAQEELTARYYRQFPREIALYVFDPSGSSAAVRNFERSYPVDRQRHDGLKVIVHPIREGEILGSLDELLNVFGGTPDESDLSRLFIRLAPPFRTNKKQLRESIDIQDRYTGEARRLLLARIFPIVGADESEPKDNTPCQQFDDDLVYLHWNFGGFVLRTDERTLELLRECLAKTLREQWVAKR